MKNSSESGLYIKQIILIVSLLVIGATSTQLLTFKNDTIQIAKTEATNTNTVLEVPEENYQRIAKVTSRGIVQRKFERSIKVEETTVEEEKYISIEEIKISRNMDLTVRCGISKEDFRTLLANLRPDTTGFFEQNSDIIYDLCEKYEINEIFFCGLIAAESGWKIASNHRNTNNFVSMMSRGKLIRYATPEEGLEAAAKLLHNSYLTEGGSYYYGKTLSDVQIRYCPDSSTWVGLVYGCMNVIV